VNNNVIQPAAHKVTNAVNTVVNTTVSLAQQAKTQLGAMASAAVIAYRSTTSYISQKTAEAKAELAKFVCTTKNTLTNAWEKYVPQSIQNLPWGTIGKVAMMVGGAALTIATLGAAGPVVGAIMVGALVVNTGIEINDMVADATGKNFIKDTICSGSAACYTAVEIGGAALGMVGPNGAAGAAKAAATAADAEKAATAATDTARIADAATGAEKAANAAGGASRIENAGEAALPLSGRTQLADAFGDEAIRNARRAPHEEGYFDVIGHGTPTDISGMPASDVAAAVRETPSWNGQDVRLLSCSTGGCPINGGESIAQQLADALQVHVKAPTTDILIDGRGKITFDPGGTWKIFSPATEG